MQYLSTIWKRGRYHILLFLVFFTLFFGSRALRIYNGQAMVSESYKVLFLQERSSLDELVESLNDLDVSFDEEELRWAAGIFGWRNFQAGRYELEGGYAYNELLSKMALGLQDLAPVTIPAGVDRKRMAAALDRSLKADSTDFAAVFTDSSSVARELGLDGQELLSRMLPDTYFFYWNSRPEQVVRRIYDEFENRVTRRMEKEIENSSLDLNQLITLASIIEWEANFQSEKARISGLYWNRLNRNMRLQADPTIIYVIGEHRRLLYEDYLIDHPYNTYIHSGLPPGPITNPDLSSLNAAVNPEEHDFLFMVANPEGGHVFTRTFEEHRLASNEWRRWIQEQYRIKRERESR